ncbi:NAD(P)-dependent oxidoreductase [Nitrospira sp. KM1]|uniref:NAD(P)-dependent oxidoreductase n=1 Tax=Nitrospira sp. KM1 TaxID=1936990 RepID=UPI001564CC52|nr:NAD(P)-dependent oxidoreductase [Nitrospira sp. KM1]
MKTSVRIGFVGIGRMGSNMARCLHEKGFTIAAVNDRIPANMIEISRELNCEASPNPARVAELAEVIVTVVSDDGAMEELYSEANDCALLCYAAGRLFINCATVTPDLHVRIERSVEARGGSTLEACMASSITQARQGTLYFICGGKRSAFEKATPFLEAMGSRLRYVGRSGEGAKVKALVNMVMNCNTAALAEGLALGDALGLDLPVLREVFQQTGAASRVLETDGEDMELRSHDCFFSAAHAAKDSGIAMQLAQSAGLNLPVARATLEQYRLLVASGKGELDKSGIAELTFKDRGARRS